MVNEKNKKPIVLVIAGHDPSGGAGIQADIESIANAGCHATTVITSLTAQNTNTIRNITPQDSIFFREQIKLVLDDMDILMNGIPLNEISVSMTINSTAAILSLEIKPTGIFS